jgi:hypothetical protein
MTSWRLWRSDLSQRASVPSQTRPSSCWIQGATEVIDTAHITADQAAQQIADSVLGR